MFHALLAFLVIIASLFHTPTYPEVINRVQASVVRVTGEMDVDTFFGPMHGSYTCTGEVIALNRVLTAGHCIGERILADGVPIKGVLASDAYYDLALLDVSTQKPFLTFRDEPVQRFEKVSALGYAFGFTQISVLDERVFLVNAIPPDSGNLPKILVQPGYIGGMSGGPVVDANGQMVGIVQQTGDNIGLGVGVLIIRAFLLVVP